MENIGIPQYLVNWGLLALSGLVGWWMRSINESVKEVVTKVHALELLVSGKYATTEALNELRRDTLEEIKGLREEGAAERAEISKKLMFIVSLLENKADKK